LDLRGPTSKGGEGAGKGREERGMERKGRRGERGGEGRGRRGCPQQQLLDPPLIKMELILL